MRVSELENAPDWLLSAEVSNENVSIVDGRVVWHGGVWHGGDWCGGVWHGGVWHGGVWRGGVWRDGVWHGGDWRDGVWECKSFPNRVRYMAALIGICPDKNGMAIAYRTTLKDGHGRYMNSFVQVEGEYFEYDLPKPGSGTCIKGTHVTTAAHAETYYGVIADSQLWRVTFHIDDLLDCDGEKARIRGGTFERIDKPWAA